MSDPTVAQITERYETLYMLATDEELFAGQVWYDHARRDILRDPDIYQRTTPLAPDEKLLLLRAAILSPQLTWKANVAAARATLDRVKPRGVMGNFWDKAMGCHWDPSLTDIGNVAWAINHRTALKTFNFALALLGDTTATVIDRHMFDAAYLTKGAGQAPWGKRLLTYRQCSQALIRVADGHHQPVTSVQATIWLCWKSLSNHRQPVGTKPLEVM